MADYIKVFKPGKTEQDKDELIRGALECLDVFGEHFNNSNIKGMDECCHFPHYLLSGNELICWEKPRQLPETFFEDLKNQGWSTTVTNYRDVILVSENKVHFKVRYTREKADGTIMSDHENVWILTYQGGKWGILLRSY